MWPSITTSLQSKMIRLSRRVTIRSTRSTQQIRRNRSTLIMNTNSRVRTCRVRSTHPSSSYTASRTCFINSPRFMQTRSPRLTTENRLSSSKKELNRQLIETSVRPSTSVSLLPTLPRKTTEWQQIMEVAAIWVRRICRLALSHTCRPKTLSSRVRSASRLRSSPMHPLRSGKCKANP